MRKDKRQPDPNFVPPASAKPAATKYITIPVAEYVYLQRVDALMDALMQDPSSYNSQVVMSVLAAAKSMRDPQSIQPVEVYL